MTFLEGGLACSRGTSRAPTGLSYRRNKVKQGSHGQGCPWAPRAPRGLCAQAATTPHQAALHPRPPPSTSSPPPSTSSSPLQRPSRAGEGDGWAAHTSPLDRAGPASPPEVDLPRSPLTLHKKPTHTHPAPPRRGWGLRGDTSDSPRGLGGSGEPPPLPTVDPAKRGRKGFYQARGLLLTKVEAVIGRVRPPPLLRAVAGHGAEAAPRRPPPPPRRRQQPRQPRRRTHNGGGRLPSPSCGRRACATPRRSPPSLP